MKLADPGPGAWEAQFLGVGDTDRNRLQLPLSPPVLVGDGLAALGQLVRGTQPPGPLALQHSLRLVGPVVEGNHKVAAHP